MSLLSILLSVVAVLCTAAGFVTTPVPVLGAVLSFGAAGIALGGVMLAGRAMSRAKREERPSDAARIAVVLNVLALVPALLVALTCGVCNALVSTGNFQASPNLRFHVGPLGPFGPSDPDADTDPDHPRPLAPPARAGAGQGEPPASGHSAPQSAGHGTAPRTIPAPNAPTPPSNPPPPNPPPSNPPPANLPPPPLPAGPGR